MKSFVRATLLGLALYGVALPAATAQEAKAKEAEEIPVVYRLTYWEVNEDTLTKLAGKSRLSAGELTGRRLQKAEVLGLSGEEAYIGLVRKSPIIYYDPRATQFQVQYVDAGVKLDVKSHLQAGQVFEVEVRQELTRITVRRTAPNGDKSTAVYPETEGFMCEASFSGVRLGEILVLGSSAAPLTRAHVKQLDSGAKAPYLLATLEMEAP